MTPGAELCVAESSWGEQVAENHSGFAVLVRASVEALVGGIAGTGA